VKGGEGRGGATGWGRGMKKKVRGEGTGGGGVEGEWSRSDELLTLNVLWGGLFFWVGCFFFSWVFVVGVCCFFWVCFLGCWGGFFFVLGGGVGVCFGLVFVPLISIGGVLLGGGVLACCWGWFCGGPGGY